MSRAWTERVAALFDITGAPLGFLALLIFAALTSALWYWYPRWLPWRWWSRFFAALRRGGRSGRSRRSRLRGTLRWKRRPKPAAEPEAEPDAVDELPDLPAEEFLSMADEYARAGRYAEAVRERLRAMVRELADTYVITVLPGATVTELAGAASRALPPVAPPVTAASAIFSDIWYGQRPATAADDDTMRHLAEQAHAVLSGSYAGGAGVTAARVDVKPVPPGNPTTRRKPWWRLVIPMAAALALIILTVAFHAAQEPDITDAGYLNPQATGTIGSSVLASRLQAAGVRVEVVSHTTDALSLLDNGGPATLFVPAPGLVATNLIPRVAGYGNAGRVVLVRPSYDVLVGAGLPDWEVGSRWATKAVPRDCAGSGPGSTGSAAVRHDLYRWVGDGTAPGSSCYSGSVVNAVDHGQLYLVGANDIFRNDRIGEFDNAALARSLLSAYPRVVWLDLHKQEQVATAPPPPADPHEPAPSPTPLKAAPQQSLPVPDWVKASFAGLVLAALIAAVAAARRLGPPVTESPPVTVRSTETASGRGRLYHRAAARGPALSELQLAADRRLRLALRVPPNAAPDDLVRAVVEQTGRPREAVVQALFGEPPANDAAFALAVAALDRLVADTLDTRATPETRATPGTAPQNLPKEWT